jgi:hypothetical protein
VCSTVFEHSSIAATLRTRFGIENLTNRMASTNDLTSCIVPKLLNNPQPPAASPPVIDLHAATIAKAHAFTEGQPELAQMVAEGKIPEHATNKHDEATRLTTWLSQAEKLGAIRLR